MEVDDEYDVVGDTTANGIEDHTIRSPLRLSKLNMDAQESMVSLTNTSKKAAPLHLFRCVHPGTPLLVLD